VEDGHYHFIGIRPVSYPIPNDGPVGRLLAALGRHPNRPAHMHFKISASGFRTLVTHTFVEGDPWLDSDAVFGVKPSLVASFVATPSEPTQWRSEYDFILAPFSRQADT
jgi:hydroxyquinol 1,2-dioxygenase